MEGAANGEEGGGVEITMDLLLEYSGQDNPDQIQMVIARNAKILSLEGLKGLELPNLEMLSLSNNYIGPQIHALGSVASQLISLNLNNNRIEDIEPIRGCSTLESLFVSNNRIRSLVPLEDCHKLRELNAFGNLLPCLDGVLNTLGLCTSLSQLDLGDNPCCFTSGYRGQVLSALPSLDMLDGEPVSRLDHELAGEIPQAITSPQPPSTPVPTHNFRDHSKEEPFAQEANLDSHPVLIEYLAESTLSEAQTAPKPSSGLPPRPSGFVSRLRGSSRESSDSDQSGLPIRPGTAMRLEAVLPGVGGLQQGHPDVVRKLIHLVEQLQIRERELQQTVDRLSSEDAASKELESLRLENKNMNHLREENKALKAQVKSLEAALLASGSKLGRQFSVVPAIGAGLPLHSEVEADYGGEGDYYKGKVIFDHGDGTFDIAYNDGDLESKVPRSRIRVHDDDQETC